MEWEIQRECPKTKGQLKNYNNEWVPEVFIRNLRTRLTVISLHGQDSLQNIRIQELHNFMRHGLTGKVRIRINPDPTGAEKYEMKTGQSKIRV
jgi:hypothetical protein